MRRMRLVLSRPRNDHLQGRLAQVDATGIRYTSQASRIHLTLNDIVILWPYFRLDELLSFSTRAKRVNHAGCRIDHNIHDMWSALGLFTHAVSTYFTYIPMRKFISSSLSLHCEQVALNDIREYRI